MAYNRARRGEDACPRSNSFAQHASRCLRAVKERVFSRQYESPRRWWSVSVADLLEAWRILSNDRCNRSIGYSKCFWLPFNSGRTQIRVMSDYGTSDVCNLSESIDSRQMRLLGLRATLSYARSRECIPQSLDLCIGNLH